MACANTHNLTQKVQGAGKCCAGLGSQTPVLGLRFGAIDSKGKCFVCEIAQSRSIKHPGKLVFRRGKGGTICPTSTGGCCSLAA